MYMLAYWSQLPVDRTIRLTDGRTDNKNSAIYVNYTSSYINCTVQCNLPVLMTMIRDIVFCICLLQSAYGCKCD